MSCVAKCIQFVMASRVACVSRRVMDGCYREIRNMSTISIPRTEWDPFHHQSAVLKQTGGVMEIPVTVPCRLFFTVPGIGNKKKEYAGRKLVGYSMEQMYTVVAEVENYKTFVPFCKKSIVWSRGPEHMRADLVIGFPPIHESYTSNIILHKPYLVRAMCTDGKLFNHMLTEWKFSPGLKGNPQSCIIDFVVSFEFRSLLHSQLAHVFFSEVVRQMEDAFIHEATNRFGKASVKTQRLANVSVNS